MKTFADFRTKYEEPGEKLQIGVYTKLELGAGILPLSVKEEAETLLSLHTIAVLFHIAAVRPVFTDWFKISGWEVARRVALAREICLGPVGVMLVGGRRDAGGVNSPLQTIWFYDEADAVAFRMAASEAGLH